MPEPKGRSGKKPKYQIADIGGADLTSEDISTERVLNFLINGELGSIAGKDAASTADNEVHMVLPPSEQPEPRSIPKTSEQASPSEQPVKKSLSHLFERAGGAPGRESSASIPDENPSSVPFPVEGQSGQAALQKPVSASQPSGAHGSIDVAALEQAPSLIPSAPFVPLVKDPLLDSTSAPLQGVSALETWDQRTDHSDQVARWKTLYRLNSGEIATLQALFRMAGENDSSNCFVKMRQLAELSGLDYRYCQKVVRSLERLGWITKLQDYDAATQLGVLYRVNSKPLHLS